MYLSFYLLTSYWYLLTIPSHTYGQSQCRLLWGCGSGYNSIIIKNREMLPLYCNISVILKSITVSTVCILIPTGLLMKNTFMSKPNNNLLIIQNAVSRYRRLGLNNQTHIRFLLFLKTTQFLPSAEIVLFYYTRHNPWTC